MNDSISKIADTGLPIVVIAGRPNVGKSTLFNRMIRSRRAITDPTPGVTRDQLEAVCEVYTKRFLLVDTGGIKADGDKLDMLVADKSLEAVKRADIVLVLLDVTAITPEDEFFIERLRPFFDKTVCLVNKVDNDQRMSLLGDFYAYGFNRIIAISAEHGLNIDEVMSFIDERLPAAGSWTAAAGHDIGLAIVGRPNTGKSTLMNRLTDTEVSLVSEIPGTTRDSVEGRFNYDGRIFRVVDTAGIRRKSKVNESVEYYSVNRAIGSIKEADIVFLLVDPAEGLSEQDKKIADQIVKYGKGVILVLSKWDLMQNIPNWLTAFSDRIRFLFPTLDFAPIKPVSAKTGEGIGELMKYSLILYDQLQKRISTGELNRALQEWIERNPPPYGRKRCRVRYITQAGASPLRFVLFINRRKGFPSSYASYVVNSIRKKFGFTHVPIILELRESS